MSSGWWMYPCQDILKRSFRSKATCSSSTSTFVHIPWSPSNLDWKHKPPSLSNPIPKLDPKEIFAHPINSWEYLALSYGTWHGGINGLEFDCNQIDKGTERTVNRCTQLLDYLAINSEAKKRFRASDMVLNIHSDGSYPTVKGACSRIYRHYFMGYMPKDWELIKLNGVFHSSLMIMSFAVASVAEAELFAPLFIIAKQKICLDSP